jgi:hypothetical protein
MVWCGPAHRRFVRAESRKGEKKRHRDLLCAAPSSVPRRRTGPGERRGAPRRRAASLPREQGKWKGASPVQRRNRGRRRCWLRRRERGRSRRWGGPPSELRLPPDRHAARAPPLLLCRPTRHRWSCPRWSRHGPAKEDRARSAQRSRGPRLAWPMEECAAAPKWGASPSRRRRKQGATRALLVHGTVRTVSRISKVAVSPCRRRRSTRRGPCISLAMDAVDSPLLLRTAPCCSTGEPPPSRGPSSGRPSSSGRGRLRPSPREARRSSGRRARWLCSPHAAASAPQEGRGAQAVALVGARIRRRSIRVQSAGTVGA